MGYSENIKAQNKKKKEYPECKTKESEGEQRNVPSKQNYRRTNW